jgi:integrase
MASSETPYRSTRVRGPHLESWVKGMTSRGLAPGTISTRYANVHAVFRAAIHDRLIAIDPAENVTLPRLRRNEAAMRLPLVDEVKRLIDAATDEFATMLALAAFAGLRAEDRTRRAAGVLLAAVVSGAADSFADYRRGPGL